MKQKVSDSSSQLPLNFNSYGNKTFQDFIVGENTVLLESLTSFLESDETTFYLWGESASGKSHILQAFIDTLNKQQYSAVIVLPQDISNRENVTLIELFDFICIDKVEKISKDVRLEEALFFWINEIKQADKKIILSSQISNHSQQWQLPDLKSRIQSGRTHEVIALGREQALAVFKQQAKKKGILLDEKILKYLLNNCPMNVKFLSSLLNSLDEATLIYKKQVTIPLLKNILQTVLVK